LAIGLCVFDICPFQDEVVSERLRVSSAAPCSEAYPMSESPFFDEAAQPAQPARPGGLLLRHSSEAR